MDYINLKNLLKDADSFEAYENVTKIHDEIWMRMLLRVNQPSILVQKEEEEFARFMNSWDGFFVKNPTQSLGRSSFGWDYYFEGCNKPILDELYEPRGF